MTDSGRALRILLVDDNQMDIELALDAIEQVRPGAVIEVARTGGEALERLVDRLPDLEGVTAPPPDLILLDLKMPGIDGLEVLRQVKQSPVSRRVPVVILTSSREEADRAMAYDAGANSYLVKPVSFDGFVGVVHRLLEYWFVLNVRPPEPVRPAGDRRGPLPR